jgi:hypothetical protein
MAAMTIGGDDRRGSAAGTLGSGPNDFGRADPLALGLGPGDAFEEYGAVGRHGTSDIGSGTERQRLRLFTVKGVRKRYLTGIDR